MKKTRTDLEGGREAGVAEGRPTAISTPMLDRPLRFRPSSPGAPMVSPTTAARAAHHGHS